MKTLFVRIGQKTGPEKFFRCGIQFGRAWTRVEVDKATAERLHAEQMLEVTEDQPDDYVEPVGEGGEGSDATAAAAATAAGGKTKAVQAKKK